MNQPSAKQITHLLLDWQNGNQEALDELMPLVYEELRRLAQNYMRKQNPGHTLQTTALVNEAYLRLIDSSQVRWKDRNHFFAISSQLMRRILVDAARVKNSYKRGGDVQKVDLEKAVSVGTEQSPDLVALDEALKRLAELNSRQSKIVEMRYFGGLIDKEIGEVLGISIRTVRRDWSVAQAWLYRELRNV